MSCGGGLLRRNGPWIPASRTYFGTSRVVRATGAGGDEATDSYFVVRTDYSTYIFGISCYIVGHVR